MDSSGHREVSLTPMSWLDGSALIELDRSMLLPTDGLDDEDEESALNFYIESANADSNQVYLIARR